MLYKYLFSILCGHLNLNKKRKKFKFDRLPVKPAGKPVKPAGIPVRTVSTGEFEFKFEFVRFRPVTGLTDPVSRNRTPAVRGDRSENLTLRGTRTPSGAGWENGEGEGGRRPAGGGKENDTTLL